MTKPNPNQEWAAAFVVFKDRETGDIAAWGNLDAVRRWVAGEYKQYADTLDDQLTQWACQAQDFLLDLSTEDQMPEPPSGKLFPRYRVGWISETELFQRYPFPNERDEMFVTSGQGELF